MSNVMASKLFQAKYKGESDPLTGVEHYTSWEDSTFFDMNASQFPLKRSLSLPLFLGAKVIQDGIAKLEISPRCAKVTFNEFPADFQQGSVPLKLRSNLPAEPMAGFGYAVDGVSDEAQYFTRTPSRGRTTTDQGAVDILAASVLFAEALRRLIYKPDGRKCRLAAEVVDAFADMTIKQSGSNATAYTRSLMRLADALYMVGAYDPSFRKMSTTTPYAHDFFVKGDTYERDSLRRIMDPKFLGYLV